MKIAELEESAYKSYEKAKERAAALAIEYPLDKSTWLAAIERFNIKYRVIENGCWEWKAKRKNNQTGSFFLKGDRIPAYKAAWLLFKGAIPDDTNIHHSCDYAPCVNPAHLYFLSKKESYGRNVTLAKRRIETKCSTLESKLRAMQELMPEIKNRLTMWGNSTFRGAEECRELLTKLEVWENE